MGGYVADEQAARSQRRGYDREEEAEESRHRGDSEDIYRLLVGEEIGRGHCLGLFHRFSSSLETLVQTHPIPERRNIPGPKPRGGEFQDVLGASPSWTDTLGPQQLSGSPRMAAP